MIASYLTGECELGRIAADADVDSLALSLIGAGHLLFAGWEGAPPAKRTSSSEAYSGISARFFPTATATRSASRAWRLSSAVGSSRGVGKDSVTRGHLS
jgi:hypothetical protein